MTEHEAAKLIGINLDRLQDIVAAAKEQPKPARSSSAGTTSGAGGSPPRHIPGRDNAAPWLLATSEDFRVRGTEGGKAGLSTRLTHRYMDRVLELSMRDLGVRYTFLEVLGMLKPPTVLFGPAIAAKVMREALFRGGKVEVAEDGSPVPEKVW